MAGDAMLRQSNTADQRAWRLGIIRHNRHPAIAARAIITGTGRMASGLTVRPSMRHALLLIFGISLVGCQANQDRAPMRSTSVHYESAPAAALVFDPPMVAYAPLPAFSREGRSPSAFYGYEQPGVETYQLRLRDTQRSDGYPDFYDRTTYSGRAITTYR